MTKPSTAIYHFADIENRTITEGYATIVIVNHEAEIANDDAGAILLAEKHGGILPVKAKSKKLEAPASAADSVLPSPAGDSQEVKNAISNLQ